MKETFITQNALSSSITSMTTKCKLSCQPIFFANFQLFVYFSYDTDFASVRLRKKPYVISPTSIIQNLEHPKTKHGRY